MLPLFRAWGALRTGAWWEPDYSRLLVTVSQQQEEVTIEGDAPLDHDSVG